MRRAEVLRRGFHWAMAGALLAAIAAVASPVARAGAVHVTQIGIASWYGLRHQGRRTASGARFDLNKLTAAHNSLPLNSKARVTNLENGRSVEVTINDRGPAVKGRVIDLSEHAARTLGMKERGLALVKIQPLDRDAQEIALR